MKKPPKPTKNQHQKCKTKDKTIHYICQRRAVLNIFGISDSRLKGDIARWHIKIAAIISCP